MRKIISILLFVTMFLGVTPLASAYYDVLESDSYYHAVNRLCDLGIISGYSDGSFGADRTITRAEFTKIVVCMMDKEEEALANATFSGFSDVAVDFWATPYINYAVSQDILSGYSDGTFCPDKTITFAEALTVLLRTAGYTEKEVGFFWPNNYISAALSMGISTGISCAKDEAITRGVAAVLVDRTLFCRPSGVQNADTYIETCGYSVLDDALVLDADTKNGSITVLSGNLKLGNASAYINKTTTMPDVGEVYAHAVLDKNGYLVAVKEYDGADNIYSETAVINKLTDNTVEYTTVDGRKGSFRMEDSFVVYHESSKMTFASAKSHFSNGADITFYGSGINSWNIAVIGNSQNIDPVLASKNYAEDAVTLEGITINKNNLMVYRNGNAATLGDIKVNDVVYYNTKTNIMDVYSKKITGVYYSAYPSKAYVESVTVGGKSYEIGNAKATMKLDASNGAFEIGDKVTLLLGKNDKVAYAVDLSDSFDYFEYGVLVGAKARVATDGDNEGNSENVAMMFMPDGQIHEIVTKGLYTDGFGELKRISYKDGKATLSNVSSNNKSEYTGEIDRLGRMIGNRYVLKDAVIIQLVSKTENGASCELLDFDHLEADNLDISQLLNVVSANSFGDIAIMLVKSLEDTYSYGVVSGFEKSGTQVVGYDIFSDGVNTTYMLGNLLKVSTSLGEGIAYKTENGLLSAIKSLKKVNSSSKLSAVEGSRIKAGSTVYKMSDNVQIVEITNSRTKKTISVDELAGMTGDVTVSLYSDKSVAQGGIVRVVTVTSKN